MKKKIYTLAELEKIIFLLKKNKKTITLCHGVFDLIHPGHIYHFEQAKKNFPPLIGGIDWQRASQEFNDHINSTTDLVSVFIEQFVPYAGMKPKSDCIVLSDDFYGLGVRLQCKIVPQLLTDWLPIPHAIFIFSNDLRFVFHVSFNRNVSFGRSVAHQK
jgi:hypothetical protein